VPAEGGGTSSSSSSDEDEAGPASALASSSSSFVGARRVSFSAQAPQQLGVSAGALAEDRERQRLRELVASGGKAPRRKKREKLPDFPYRCDLAGIAPPCPCFAPNVGMHNGPIKGAAKPLECMHCGYARALHNAHVAPPPPRPALPAVARVKISPKAGFHAVKGDELAVTLSCATKVGHSLRLSRTSTYSRLTPYLFPPPLTSLLGMARALSLSLSLSLSPARRRTLWRRRWCWTR